ncbi:sugar phosphate isomerase/epimerase [Pontibacter diazotrophicus]|uniref:Sugar phosphate isomerase/epimerase n=1 Tax=Pontibacter diazotrophicus TaxID=1400979 RepID=A0A3D8LG10_9BACT|nr:sugar phosphate isomerase/epimerase [Pontibacter diazotrophicus]RDV16381.1 sugar phosphate isomerase/epimerase [Pontibacter diazotrophicus]
MNKRRSFLRYAGLMSAGVFMTPALISCGTNNEANEDTATTGATADTGTATANTDTAIGIQLYSLREQIGSEGIEVVIPKVAEAGYKKVETYGYSQENGFFGMEPSAFNDLLRSHNLTSPSGHYSMDPYLSGGNEEMLQSFIDAAKAIGQTYIVIPHIGDSLRQSADDYRKLAQRINEAAQKVNEEGLQLAYHNHAFEFDQFGDTTGYQILLEETDPELVKMELDLYWVYRAEKDPVAMMNENPNRFVMWHVKDMDRNDRTLNTEIGSGSIDYQSLFNQSASNVEHIYVEQENFAENMDPYQSIRQSHDYVTNTLLS